jgi:plastocyanin
MITRHQRLTLTLRVGAFAGVAGLALAACSGGTGTQTASASPTTASTTADMPAMDVPTTSAAPVGPAVPTDQVTISNFAFGPAVITVKAGTTVTWTNMDEEPHTVTDGAQGIKSPVLGNQGSTYSHTFASPGMYSYNCSIHPFMHGVVMVTA